MRLFFFIALLLAIASTSEAAPKQLWGDANDLARYGANADAKLIVAAKKDPRFTAGGASFKFDIHMSSAAVATPKGSVYSGAAMMSDASGKLFYRTFAITVGGNPRKVVDVQAIGDKPLAEMHFAATTGLLDREVVVEDVTNGITLLFPLGVGGVDEAVMGERYRLLTPKFQNAHLDRAAIIPQRTEPSYYRGRPFMPIVTSSGNRTAIAFHISILGDEQAQKYGLNYLVRGFESHGCMRMREKDLLEFFTIVMNGADDKIPVNVGNHVWNMGENGQRLEGLGASSLLQPYPTNESSYMRVTYFDEAPHWRRDDIPNEHLVIMDRAAGAPDMSKLDGRFAPAGDFEQAEDLDLLSNEFQAP